MDVNKDLKYIKLGFEGESRVRKYLNKVNNCFYAQLDIIAKIDDIWYSIEVKHQAMFKAPPFNGHGLPEWQIKTRLKLFHDTGIIPLFFVLDKKTQVLMYNSLINLEAGKKFTTGKKKRVIYPLENFLIIEE